MNRSLKWMALKYYVMMIPILHCQCRNTKSEALTSRRKREGYTLGSFSGETHWGTAFSADLGGSSKYSSGCGSLRTEVEKGFILIAIIYE